MTEQPTEQPTEGPTEGRRERLVDARPILAAGREPFDTIMAAVTALGREEDLVVLAPFEPVPLEGLLSSHGFRYEATPLQGGDWRVRFCREP